jgi:hypothetical protein
MLNPSCPIVRAHFCEASAETVEVNLRLGRRDRAERAGLSRLESSAAADVMIRCL